jgi:hypothetical protein
MVRIPKQIVGVLLLAAAAMLTAGAVADGWGPLNCSFDTCGLSKLVWRGWTLNDHNVYEPSITLDYKPFSFNVWANYDAGDTREWDEIDYTLSYGNEGNRCGWSVGHIWYTCPNHEEDAHSLSGELFASVAANKWPWSPTISYYHDYDEGGGDYAQLSLNTQIPVGEQIPWRLGLGLGYNIHQWRQRTGFSDCTATLAIPLKLGRTGPVVVPVLGYSMSLDERYYKDQFFAGVDLPLLR